MSHNEIENTPKHFRQGIVYTIRKFYQFGWYVILTHGSFQTMAVILKYWDNGNKDIPAQLTKLLHNKKNLRKVWYIQVRQNFHWEWKLKCSEL